MHTGNQPPFAGGLAQQDLPGTPGLFRIDVEGDRGFWPRRLNGREMDAISPRSAARYRPLRDDTRYARAYGWRAEGTGGSGDHLPHPSTPLICAAQFASTRRTSSSVAPTAIAGVVERGCCQPVSAFPRRQEHRGVGIRWRTSGGQQAADMVRMGVGERMASISSRTNAEPRQIGDKFAANAIGSAGAGIHQHRIPRDREDQIGANRNGLRRG